MPPPIPQAPPTKKQFPCKQCGAALEFAPGQASLVCPWCKAENQIAISRTPIEEYDFRGTLAALVGREGAQEQLTVRCDGCGAESSLAPNTTADRCPFCASPIVAQAISQRKLKPRSLLPFHVKQEQAATAFRTWVSSRWFAPTALRKADDRAQLKGVYLPYWTYDANTFSHYTGQRGDDYWDTETYTTTENGQTVVRTRQVKKTRWYFVTGTVSNAFDDILIPASNSLPRKYVQSLEPWDLTNLTPYADEFIAGFVAESYQVDLETGFGQAKQVIDSEVEASVRRDIGGDHQRIDSINTQYNDITFKHLLLPVWVSAYRFQGRTFVFIVNARTGEVCGERPYSWIKITLFVLMIVLIVAIAFAVAAR